MHFTYGELNRENIFNYADLTVRISPLTVCHEVVKYETRETSTSETYWFELMKTEIG